MATDLDLAGLVPVSVDVDAETVTFAPAGASRFNEPFYDQSVRPLAQSSGTVVIPFGALHDASRRVAVRPAGLIFHTARCGSTLLTQMLRHNRRTLVLSEPTVLNRPRPGPTDEPISPVVLDVLAALSSFADRRAQQLVVKLSSWQSRAIATFSAALPSTPLLFLYRPAEAVIASLLADPPGWSPYLSTARALPWAADELPTPDQAPVDWYLAIWRMSVRAALALPEQRLLFLSYDTLRDDPRAVLEKVATHLRLAGDWRPETAAAELQYYAKSIDPTERFEPDGRHQRPPLDEPTRSAVRERTAELLDAADART